MWDEGNSNAPLGLCTAKVPVDPGHSQKMRTEWLELTSPEELPAGRVRLGIQYIYDQVKLIDTVVEKRKEEREFHLKDLEESVNALRLTSAPFELLIGPMKGTGTQTHSDPTAFDDALDKVATTFSRGIAPIENYVVDHAKALPATPWRKVALVGSLVYVFLCFVIVFANEDFVNVLRFVRVDGMFGAVRTGSFLP